MKKGKKMVNDELSMMNVKANSQSTNHHSPLIKDGYKKTEIGIIPEDWEVKMLGEIGSFKNGINKSKDDFGFGYPFVNLMDVFGKPKIYGNENFELINSNDAERNLYNLKFSDLLFIRSSVKPSGVGLTTVISKNLKETVFSGFLIRFRDNGKLDIDYKKHCFYEEKFRAKLISNSSVSANTNINQDALKGLLIPLPPLPEQKAIAEVLSDTDELIQTLEKKIAKKRLIKQGAMQVLLSPPATTQMVNEELSMINGELSMVNEKEKWEVKKLGEIISFVIDNRGKTPPIVDSGNPLIEVNAIYKQGKNPNYNLVSKFVDDKTYQNWFRDGHPKPGDILIVTVGSAGTTSYINKNIGCIAQNIIGLRTFKQYSSEFLYYLTKTRLFKEKVKAVLMGGVQPSLKVPHINNFEFSFPSINEQTRIATILSDMDSEIETLENKLAKYKKIKQGMMQELLTGKTRLF